MKNKYLSIWTFFLVILFFHSTFLLYAVNNENFKIQKQKSQEIIIALDIQKNKGSLDSQLIAQNTKKLHKGNSNRS